jgi:uncharacterized phage-like protein YoqJ
MKILMEPNITLTITGLRSHKLYGKNYSKDGYIDMVNFTIDFLLKSPFIIAMNNGMATGTDLITALAAVNYKKMYNNSFKLNLYIPGDNQTASYDEEELRIYNYVLSNADNVYYLAQGEPTDAENLKKRNRKMVDESQWVLGFWDGKKKKSGTWSTINYATKKDKNVLVVNPHMLDKVLFLHMNEHAEETGMKKRLDVIYN